MTAIVKQKTQEWQEQRKMRITGSRIGAILGLSPWQKPRDIIREMVRQYHGTESEFVGGPHIDHGNNNEQRALLCFMRESGLSVEEAGFLEYGERLGASPDGLTSDGGVLELKVPFSLRDGGEFKPLSEQPHYYAQIQMEMLSANATHGWFAQYIAPKGDPLDYNYVPEQIKIERVDRDENWIDDNLVKINEFYTLLLAEIDNPDHLEPLRVFIDDAASEARLSRIRESIKTLQDEEKQILDKLVALADGKNAELPSGSKLTLVERKGSVSYAKVVKDHLPDLDLEKYRGKPSSSWRLTLSK